MENRDILPPDVFRGDENSVKKMLRKYVDYFLNCHSVLDIGSGRGEFLELLMERNISCYGIDISSEMVEISKKKGLNVEQIDAVSYLKKKVSSMDDVFTLNPKRTIKMCEEIINRGIKVSWDCATRVEVINEELVKWMAKANCVGVALGVESGSPKIISSIGKGISIEQIKKAFHLLREYGIDTGIFLMVGNPGENRYTIKETSNLVSELVKDYFRIRNGRQCGDNLLEGISLSDLRSVAALQLYPNTPVYELSKKQGFITDDYWLSEKPVPIYTYENPMEELEFFIFNIIFHAQKSRGFFKFIHFLFDFAKRDIKHLLKMVLVYFKVFRYIKKVKELIF